MRGLGLVLAAAVALSVASAALAFGTISGLGQNREHERITRHALGCGPGVDASVCFQPASLDEIAGKAKTWGAVGAPDNPARGLMPSSYAHCDNADYVQTPGYPHSQADAQAMLVGCRAAMNAHLDEAVRHAARLLNAQGRVDDAQMPTHLSCTYLGRGGRAKCDVLEAFGQALHASQDFYSHSNWVDLAAPGAVSLDNPQGLGQRGRAPWLDLRRDRPFPAGLITGCFDSISLVTPAAGCPGHVKHEALNKDKGTIDPAIGAGTTARGRTGDNFKRAVEAAIDDTRDKWATLRERLVTAYGPAKGALMACALTHDDPARTCG